MTSPLERKLKVTGPVVITANRLGDGAVIYRTPDGWSSRLDAAAVVTTAAAASDLLAAAVADDVGAVGAYVAAVQLDREGHVLPANLRETIRYRGPTIELPASFGS
jgi:predicted NAD/FAD-binding protein